MLGYDAAKLPLFPEWQYFVKLCNDEKVTNDGAGSRCASELRTVDVQSSESDAVVFRRPDLE